MADLRPQYTEEVVAHGHPTKADVTNRAYNVDHEPDGTHKNVVIHKQHINSDVIGPGLAGGAGTALSVDGIVEAGSTELKVKIVNIGTWDMNATQTVNIAHGLTLANIRHIEALIRNDDDNLYYMIHGSGSANDAWMTVDGTNVNMTRITTGTFDSDDFNSISGDNRGFITIWYVA